jgi:ADP-ribosylglycohydrolase
LKTSAVLVGCGVGDALGLPFEKLGDEVDKRLPTWDGTYQACKRLQLPPGSISDDTEMSICLATSLISTINYDGEDAAKHYLAWSQATPHGMGGSTKIAMARLAAGTPWTASGVHFDDPNQVGSGPPMRASPLGVRYFNDQPAPNTMLNACRQDAFITHANPEAVAASYAVALAVCFALDNVDPNRLLRYICENVYYGVGNTLVANSLRVASIQFVTSAPHPEEFTKQFSGRRGNAWQIVSTAIYCAAWAENFRDGVIAAVKLGGDADTRGAIAGAILGARFGLEGIPNEYKNGLLEFEKLRQLDEALINYGGGV